jgi:beta-lactamase superfamily II metal-dependent hydrolase
VAVLVFHSVSPVGILVNLLVIPLAFGILSLGLCGVLCAPVVPLSAGINRLNALLAGILLKVVRVGAELPGGHWAAANPFLKQPDFVLLDTGNGAALLLDLPGKPWLFDCGSEAQFETLLLPALRNYGLDRLEGLALSHGDAAHIGGEDVPDLVLVEDAREARVAVGHVDLPAGMMTRDFHSKTDQD